VLITGAVDDAACEAESKCGADVEGKREVEMDYVIPIAFFSSSLAYDEPNSLSAYQTCLGFEKQLVATEKVRLVRLLGYLLLYAPFIVKSRIAFTCTTMRQISQV
jgi:hypothetical protein